jgi:cell wall assembly regulator SMI1
MAKVTNQEITQVFRQLEEVYSRALAENTALEAKANQLAQSINQPDAQQKLDQLLSERLAIQSNANNQIQSLNATLDGYIANSTNSQKKLIINEKKRVNEIALRAKAVGDNVGNNIIPDLQAQISAPITAETPAPTFNTDVEDVPNENDLTGEADGDFQSGYK